MGWKDWVYGDLVSAADFQSLVQDQTVQRYASSSARSAALGSAVAEGMVSYLDDTNAVEVYNGSAWTGVSSIGSGNAIINGAFDVWQRGTSFTPTGATTYTADRSLNYFNGSGTYAVSRQTFTPGTAPVSGYEGAFFYRFAQSVAGTGQSYLVQWGQPVEDVRTFAGQTVTLSFWAKADTARSFNVFVNQYFGVGGSTEVVNYTTVAVTTSWARYSYTLNLASISGKTIGTGSYLNITIQHASGITNVVHTVDIWGVQLESGSSATPFKRNAPSIQGELAACQRYYVRFSGSSNFNNIGLASALNSTTGGANFQLPVPMRVAPTSLDSGGTLYTSQYIGVSQTITAISYRADSSPYQGVANFSVASGLNTSYRYDVVTANTGSGNYVGFSAEL